MKGSSIVTDCEIESKTRALLIPDIVGRIRGEKTPQQRGGVGRGISKGAKRRQISMGRGRAA